MGRGIGVIAGQPHGGGGLGRAGDAGGDQRVHEPGEVLAVDAVCKTGKGRGPGQVLRGLQRRPCHTALQQGGVPETLGIMASRIPRGDLRETLGQEVPERMIYIGLGALVLHSGGKAVREPHLALDATEQEGAKVG